MAGYHSFIGYPWIIDCLAKYDNAGAKQRPVPGQVVEFLRIPDHSVSSEDCQYPEAVVNISDQKYYIRAVITKEAQQILESEDEHFTLTDLKNKIVILKNFSVCFAVVEDLNRCEFYLTVQHFSVLPMETNTVDLLNCNVEPGVRKKIKELWQDYMTELEVNESSHDMNLSDVSLSQLLMVASEEKFNALKSIAEQCLELNPLVTQHNSPPDRTFWSTERRNQESTERFVIPVDFLLIPPHEEAILEQITAQLYSTALSTLSEDPVDEGPTQSGNPWNKLQSLCISVATSSDSQPKCSPVNEVGSDPDSSTPDIFTCHSDVSLADSPYGKKEISPLMFLENSSNPQQPSTSIPEQDSTHCNTGSNYSQGKSINSSAATLSLIPLTQNSPQKSLSGSSKVLISPIKFQISQDKSEITRSPANKGEIFSLREESNTENSPRTRKATKRKPTSDDLERTLSDLEQKEPECVERPDSVTTIASSSEETDKVSDRNNVLQTVALKQLREREAAGPVLEIGKNGRKIEQYIQTHVQQSRKSCKRRIQVHKPSLQFVVNPKDSAKEPTPSKVCIQEAPTNATHRQPSFQATEKLAHLDGTPFQYKYTSPAEDLCAHVKAIQIPAELCEWAVKILSDHQEKLL